jgi:hypothetical protein
VTRRWFAQGPRTAKERAARTRQERRACRVIRAALAIMVGSLVSLILAAGFALFGVGAVLLAG